VPRALTHDEIESFRDDLCRAATRLFAEHGVEGVTLRAIAGELGCSAMTPYRYFANKEEIFRTVRLAGFEDFGGRIHQAAALHPDDPRERFRALGRAYLQFALDEPHAYRVMFQLDREGDPEDEEFQAVTRNTWGPLLDTARVLIARGDLVGDPNVIGHLAWVTLHGAVTLHLSGHLRFDCSIDDLAEPILDLLLPPIPARPAEEPR
jgi:AcrR family transcriptional regulator